MVLVGVRNSATQTTAKTGPEGVKAAREVTVAGLVSMGEDRLWGIDGRLPPSRLCFTARLINRARRE